jgi:nucleotide-binding universal stress UspA family protein
MTVSSSSQAAGALDTTAHYLVDTPEGPVGVVDGWELDEHGRPTALVVAQSWFGRHRLSVPVRHVTAIDHRERRVAITAGAAPLERRGLLQRLLDRPSAGEDGGPARARTDTLRGRPVLCGVAADRRAPTVLTVAASLAESLGARLVAVHVTPAAIPPGVSAAPWGQARLREAEHEDGEQLLDSLLARAGARAETGRIVTPGRPAETLEQLALRERARLLVVGCSGKGALASLLGGSVSRRLACHAPCPVVLVPPGVESVDLAEVGDAEAGAVPRRWPAQSR